MLLPQAIRNKQLSLFVLSQWFLASKRCNFAPVGYQSEGTQCRSNEKPCQSTSIHCKTCILYILLKEGTKQSHRNSDFTRLYYSRIGTPCLIWSLLPKVSNSLFVLLCQAEVHGIGSQSDRQHAACYSCIASMVCFRWQHGVPCQAELETKENDKHVDVEERGHSQLSMRRSLRWVSPCRSSMLCLA